MSLTISTDLEHIDPAAPPGGFEGRRMIPVRVVEPNPAPNAEQRTGLGWVIGVGPRSYAPVEGRPWVVVLWPDRARTREPLHHVKRLKGYDPIEPRE